MHYLVAITSRIGSIQALHNKNSICDTALDPNAAIKSNINVELKFLTKLVEDPRVLQQVSTETNREFLY